MSRSAGGLELFVRSIITLGEAIQKARHHVFVSMSKEKVVDMPANRQLVTVNHFISNAGIIRIDGETDGEEIGNKFVVEK